MGSKNRMNRLELEARAVEKSMDHSDHTNEEDKHQEVDPQEWVAD